MSNLNSSKVEALTDGTGNVYLMAHSIKGYDVAHPWNITAFLINVGCVYVQASILRHYELVRRVF